MNGVLAAHTRYLLEESRPDLSISRVFRGSNLIFQRHHFTAVSLLPPPGPNLPRHVWPGAAIRGTVMRPSTPLRAAPQREPQAGIFGARRESPPIDGPGPGTALKPTVAFLALALFSFPNDTTRHTPPYCQADCHWRNPPSNSKIYLLTLTVPNCLVILRSPPKCHLR